MKSALALSFYVLTAWENVKKAISPAARITKIDRPIRSCFFGGSSFQRVMGSSPLFYRVDWAIGKFIRHFLNRFLQGFWVIVVPIEGPVFDIPEVSPSADYV